MHELFLRKRRSAIDLNGVEETGGNFPLSGRKKGPDSGTHQRLSSAIEEADISLIADLIIVLRIIVESQWVVLNCPTAWSLERYRVAYNHYLLHGSNLSLDDRKLFS